MASMFNQPMEIRNMSKYIDFIGAIVIFCAVVLSYALLIVTFH